MTLNSLTLRCGCHVWRFRRRWIPDHVCAVHADRPKSTGTDWLRRLPTRQGISA